MVSISCVEESSHCFCCVIWQISVWTCVSCSQCSPVKFKPNPELALVLFVLLDLFKTLVSALSVATISKIFYEPVDETFRE